MSRDNHTWTLNSKPRLSRLTVKTGKVTHYGVANHVWYRSNRSDSIPTTPTKGGVYYTPTVYGAFKASVRVREGKVKWYAKNFIQPNNPLYNVYYEDFWLSDYGANAPGILPWHEMFANPETGLPSISSYCIATARNRLLSAAKGSNFSGLQEIGELRETVRSIVGLMRLVKARRAVLNSLLKTLGVKTADDARSITQFRDTIRRYGGYLSASGNDLGRGLDALKRDARRYNRAARSERLKLPSRVASAYLGYIYGVVPVIQSAHQLAEAIGYTLNNLVSTVAVEVVDRDFGIGQGYLKSDSDWKFSGEAKQGVKAAMTFRVRNPELFDAWRYGLLNPASAAWELTPLSFIVDWFTGIGSFLNALDSSIALDNLSNYETHFLVLDVEARYRIWRPATSYQVYQSGDEWKVHDVSQRAFRRMVSPVPPIPPVYFRVNLNWSQVASILAIVVSNATGR